MPYLPLDGRAAIDHLMSRHAHTLAAKWDGENERVGFILHDGFDNHPAKVGFWSREEVPARLRALGVESPGDAGSLELMAAALAKGPPPRGVQCVLYGPGSCAIVELEPDDLRSPQLGVQRVTNDDVAAMLERCSSPEGAAAAVAELRILFRADGRAGEAELGTLEQVIEEQWEDLSALCLAVGQAREATETLLPTHVGQRARLVLNMLDQVVTNRSRVGVNARGGSA